jgi:competence protein ComFC
LFSYQDETIKKSIWFLKYHNKKIIGEKLGKLLYENFLETINEARLYGMGQKIIITPVPISRNRKKHRGYNQSEIIAKGFYLANKEIFELRNDIVIKIKDTTPQAKITNRNKRLKNMVGVFDIKNREIIKNRTIIVIDDVTTTGATINEIIKILQKNKAKKVIGLAIAH